MVTSEENNSVISKPVRDLSGLDQTSFDVVIVGGGISGAWLALHCADQGLTTALIEKQDYASQTSSSSSKLLHGGIRYLQQMQFGKVRESALERAHYLHAAPHLSVAVPFVIPTYSDFQRSKFFLNCGMLAYRVLCLGENRLIGSTEQELPPIRSFSRAQLNAVCDLGEDPHTGGVVFYERHMHDSERMVLAILQTARDKGAQVHNYVSAQDFIFDPEQISSRITGIAAKDELTGTPINIKSKLVINAAGPWIDQLNSKLKNAEKAPSINGFAVGSHIITRQLSDHAIAITTEHQSNATIDRGGRHVFIIPWRGHSLIGTSYDDISEAKRDLGITSEQVEQLLDAVNNGLAGVELSRDDIITAYSGHYLLLTENIKHTVYQGSGEYQIIDHAQANEVDGLVTALGAKFTTGRKLSALTMRVVMEKLNRSKTELNQAPIKLLSSEYQSLAEFTGSAIERYAERLDQNTIEHLVRVYGSQLDEFMQSLTEAELLNPISPTQPDILGQVKWAVLHEQAINLYDVLFHRTSLGLLGIDDQAIDRVAQLMATQLTWSDTEMQSQIDIVKHRIAQTASAIQG